MADHERGYQIPHLGELPRLARRNSTRRSSPITGEARGNVDARPARPLMSPSYDKLKALLRELFQLDQPELDFGLYRIMHAKRAEVTKFLDEELLPQVKTALAQHLTADRADLERGLAKVVASVRVSSFILSNTRASVMEKEWSPMKKAEMEERNILFQSDDRDSYVEAMLAAAGLAAGISA
jgi:hypothetical protein